jgi:lantibiotic biosynthesis protein
MDVMMEMSPLGMVRFASMPFELLESLALKQGDDRDLHLRKLFEDPFINEAIYVASRSLHERLTSKTGNSQEQRDHLDAFAKYLQRMTFRATPFGLFASAGVARVGATLRADAPTLGDLKRRCRLDWSAVFQLSKRASEGNTVTVATNDTIGVFDDRIRYVSSHSQATANGQRHFTLEEADLDDSLRVVLEAASKPISRRELVQTLTSRSENRYSANEWSTYINALLDAQILCFDHLTPLTADNPLKPLAAHAHSVEIDRIDASLSSAERAPLHQSSLPLHRRVDAEIAQLGVGQASRSNVQVDLFDTRDAGLTLSRAEVDAVERAVKLVLQPSVSLRAVLTDFIRRFTDRFGSTRVPILIALDGSSGVGYGATIEPGNDLLRAFGAFGDREAVLPPSRMVRETSEYPLGRPADDLYSRLTPDSLSAPSWPDSLQPRVGTANCSLWRDHTGQATVEVRGVSTRDAGRMYGRFAHALAPLRELLSTSDTDDADEVIAEVVHLPVDRMANVATRPPLSRYEIPIRTGTSPEATPLPLSDLSLFVRNNRLHLYSESLKKVVRPRVSNAHLPKGPMQLGVYKLLLDMVSQEVTGVQFSLRTAFPGATFLPGLVIDGVIVGRPTWRIPDHLRAKSHSAAHLSAATDGFRQWAREVRLPTWFTAIQGDNVLPIHLASDWMVTEMLKLFSSKDRMDLSDVSPLGMKPFASNGLGETHHHEIVVDLSNRAHRPQRVYAPMKHDATLTNQSQTRWEYVRLYAGHHQQHAALMELAQVLNGKNFFFVRYSDHDGPHLRVRLKRTTGGRPLADIAENLRRQGYIHSYATDIYVPEIERYGGPLAHPLLEELFCHDSTYVLDLLSSSNLDTHSRWIAGVSNMHSYLHALGLVHADDQMVFASRACADFEREFQFSKNDRATVGKIFRSFPPTLERLHQAAASEASSATFPAEIADFWHQAVAVTEISGQALYGIRWSIIHMHANRLFPAQQRSHEAVCWQLLRRVLLRETKRVAPEV